MSKLKTFVAQSGFHEMAVAAPSMTAALAAWGFTHNAFHQGFAKATTDAKIVAAATARPGIVLRRPIGTKGEFQEAPELPRAPKGQKRPKAKKPDAAKLKAAETALRKAQAGHQRRSQALQKQAQALEAEISAEDTRWQKQQGRLETARDRAAKPR